MLRAKITFVMPPPPDRYDENRKHQAGKSGHGVDETGNDEIGAAAHVARQAAERYPNQECNHLHGDADGHRGPCTVDETAQVVAANFVGAKRVPRQLKGKAQHTVKIYLVVGKWGNQVGEYRQEKKEQDDCKSDYGQPVAQEPSGCVLPECSMAFPIRRRQV